MMFLHMPPFGQPPGDFTVPERVAQRAVCARSGKLPTRLCEKTINEWFIDGKAPAESCDVHREYRIRTADGRERTRTYLVFPPEYRAWASSEGVPVPPPGSRENVREGRSSSHIDRLMIVSPNTGDYFKIDPVLRREYQTITIAGFVPRGLSGITLRVNGGQEIPFDETGVRWQLQKGVFRFQLSGYAGEKQCVSLPVVINVE
jgi:hypothetical protein